MADRAAPQAPRTIVLFGVPFHDVDMQETIAWIEQQIAERRPNYIVTANLDFAAKASGDVELQRILVEAGLVVCDGTPLVWASRLAGHPLRERVAGADLVPRLAAVAAQIVDAAGNRLGGAIPCCFRNHHLRPRRHHQASGLRRPHHRRLARP